MIYLVTGCGGFIGHGIAKELLSRGHVVIGVDDLNEYYDSQIKLARISDLATPKRFSFYLRDLSTSLDGIMSKWIDGIFHMAATPGVRYSITDPLAYIKSNVTATTVLLEAARRHGINRIVIASTSSLYAGHEAPFTEDMACNTPLCPYSASKKAVESLAYTYHHLHGLNVACTRFFTVYGPNGRPDMAPRIFTENIINGTPITVYGDGRQRRDFTFINDIVDGCIRAMGVDGYEIINLGSGQPHELIELIRLIEMFTGDTARVEHLPEQPGDMLDTHANIDKAGRLLSWEPLWTLEQGVAAMVEWHLQRSREAA